MGCVFADAFNVRNGWKTDIATLSTGMAEEIVQVIDHPLGAKRVVIVRRSDGCFAYRWQERCDNEWGPASIDAGVYDSAETAETEARQRQEWLKDLFH